MELVVSPVVVRAVIFSGGVLSSSGAKTVKCVTFAVVVFVVVLTVLFMDTHLLDILLKQVITPEAFIVPFVVVAVPGMASADHYTICTFLEGRQHESRIHPSRTHDPDHPDVGSVCHPGSTGQVSACIGAPVAQERNDCRFEFLHDIDI